MKYGNLVMGKKDYVTIIRHRYMGYFVEDYTHKHALETLEEDMADAMVLDIGEMPEDIIRLYSWVTVSSASGWRENFQVVLPGETDIHNDRISVQSTLGASVIGLAESDVIQYGTPIGIIPLKIEKVEQSEGYIREYIPDEVFDKFLPKQKNKEMILHP
jgi:regulator of nucleoside diphosphate kinase